MFNLSSLRELFVHMEWADSLVWSTIMASDAACADAAMLEKLRHLHRTQQYFMRVWRGETPNYEQLETTLEEELELAHAFHDEARLWIGTLTDEALTRELSMPWADRFARRVGAERAHPTLLGETMFQVVAHSTYHRGQANTLLRQAGETPPLVDYIGWLWLGRPAPRWP